MTIAIQNAGWESGVHLINAFIFITCLSAVNSSIYIGSRTLLYMAQDGKAPKFLGWTDRRGVPIPAIVFTNLCGALSMMNVSTGAGQAYTYIVNLSGVSTFLVWGGYLFHSHSFPVCLESPGVRPGHVTLSKLGVSVERVLRPRGKHFSCLCAGLDDAVSV